MVRTADERIAAVHSRAADMKRESRHFRANIARVGSAAVCVLAVVVLAVAIPDVLVSALAGGAEGVPGEALAGGAAAGVPDTMHGSIFADSSYLGYIVVGIVAFLLGVVLTMFLFSLKRWQDEKDQEDSAL